jgi:hypothetical protein
MKSICFSRLAAGLLLFGACTASAQKGVVPGYQGKRITLEINQHFTPALFSFTPRHTTSGLDVVSEDEDKNTLLAFNFQTQAALTYAVSRHLSVQAEYGFGKSAFEHNAVLIDGGFDFVRAEGFYENRYSHIGIGFLNFPRNGWGLAPVGPYWGMKIIRVSTKAKLREARYGGLTEGWVSPEAFPTEILDRGEGKTGSYIDVGYTLGAKKVFMDRFLFNLGLTLHFRSYLGNSSDDNYEADAGDIAPDNAAANARGFVFVGLGVLL